MYCTPYSILLKECGVYIIIIIIIVNSLLFVVSDFYFIIVHELYKHETCTYFGQPTIYLFLLSPPPSQSQLEHQMWFKYLRSAIHHQDASKEPIGPLALEDGGLIQRRQISDSPARRARELGHTRSVPIL